MTRQAIYAVFKISSLAFLVLASLVPVPCANCQEDVQSVDSTSMTGEPPVRHNDAYLLASGSQELSDADSLTIPSSVDEIRRLFVRQRGTNFGRRVSAKRHASQYERFVRGTMGRTPRSRVSAPCP